MTEIHKCEVCDSKFLPMDSDSNDPIAYCSRECEDDRAETVAAMRADLLASQDYDFSMNQ